MDLYNLIKKYIGPKLELPPVTVVRTNIGIKQPMRVAKNHILQVQSISTVPNPPDPNARIVSIKLDGEKNFRKIQVKKLPRIGQWVFVVDPYKKLVPWKFGKVVGKKSSTVFPKQFRTHQLLVMPEGPGRYPKSKRVVPFWPWELILIGKYENILGFKEAHNDYF